MTMRRHSDHSKESADPRLREAWTSKIQTEDYDAHMSAVGQAQANADLVFELFNQRPPKDGSKVLFAGAGTGQMFDFVSAEFLKPVHATFADINGHFLEKLRERLGRYPELRFETAVDDVEQTKLTSGFQLVIAVLVLEHVDWRKAIESMCKLSRSRVFVILQENPPKMTAAMTANRRTFGSMKIFRRLNPCLVPPADVEAEFCKHGFRLCHSGEREVLDGKKMVGLEFTRL